jgi:hypothetical protein
MIDLPLSYSLLQELHLAVITEMRGRIGCPNFLSKPRLGDDQGTYQKVWPGPNSRKIGHRGQSFSECVEGTADSEIDLPFLRKRFAAQGARRETFGQAACGFCL